MRVQTSTWVGFEYEGEKRTEISVVNGTIGSKADIAFVALHLGYIEISLYLSPEVATEIADKLLAEVAKVKAQAALANQAIQ